MDRAMKRSSPSSFVESPPKAMKIEDRYGSTGTPVQLAANYFRVNKQPDFVLTQYRVDFVPELDVTATRKKIMWENREKIGTRYIFDGGSIYLTQNFPDLNIDTQFNGNPMQIKLRRTGVIDSSNPIAFQLYNLIFREAMVGLKLQNIRRDYYDPQAKIDVPAGNLELWPGYLTSIRSHENDVLMCAEISHKFMRKDTVMDITKRIMRESPGDWQDKLKREVIGTTVLTEYTNKTYFIDDIDFQMTPLSTFTSAHSTEAETYADYYKRKYNIDINDPNQFLLVSKAKERNLRAGQNELIFLIPELCRATGMTDAMRNNFKLMQDVSSYTRLNPVNRVKALQKFNQRIQSTPASTAVLAEWKMELDKDLLTVPGRELPPETIVFGNSNEMPANEKGEWMFRKGTTMHSAVKVQRWIVVFPISLKEDVHNFLRILYEVFQQMSVEYTEPLLKELQNDQPDSYIKTIKEIAPRTPNMILMVLPTNRADRYSAVKKSCLVDFGIPAQVVVKRTINHKNVRSIAEKIAIQMNAKMGGIPWMIKLPVKGLMTVGFDVSLHPRDKSRSIGALVATMDLKKSGAFYSITASHRDGNEMNVQLAHHMEKAIEIYKETCGAVPEKIVFYRDGVGEGQIQFVHSKEIAPLLLKLESLFQEPPKLAYIIVNKRTNSRMFKRVGQTYLNPKPGTVVDRQITLPERNDFFLISQHVGQGTVSPTAYNVIYNTTGLDKDKLEILTYKFTHLYFNWSGTTRIPAVCQYAKKLAYLTSQSLETRVHEKLVRSLYFL